MGTIGLLLISKPALRFCHTPFGVYVVHGKQINLSRPAIYQNVVRSASSDWLNEDQLLKRR